MSSRADGDGSSESRDYAAAYAAHYSDRDLVAALGLYQEIVAVYPDAREAGYSRTQIVNIVGSVVPQADLLDAQLALALDHLGNVRASDRAESAGPIDPGQRE
jgi:hypothetical protein